MGYQTEFFNSLTHFSASQWSSLNTSATPFLSHTFLSLLENTGCVGDDTGWQPHHMAVFDGDTLIAVVPGYLKYDSYGEYVFDHGWANAYHQHGLAYYPKWVNAVPFTPVTGPRFLLHPDYDAEQLIHYIAQQMKSLLADAVSSAHVLFPFADTATQLAPQGFLRRYSVQFQWYNYHYQSFDDFLQALTSRKRKGIKKARNQLSQQGVTIERKTGQNISREDIAFFIRCYQATYLKRSGHTGYLNEAFFYQLAEKLSDQLLLVVASTAEGPCASSLLLFDGQALYGRYWGALQEINELHFECCYYQGIEFSIENKLQYFNPGTQGEHKLIRGFEPVYCTSSHYLFEPVFHQAVKDFLHRETHAIAGYFKQATDVLPYNDKAKQQLNVFTISSVGDDITTTRTEN
ncbi:N-acetyltransferase [Salinimonas sp. HHU 13199]|uniref:N-acetyltransferase n=1 Tax=Salinimonas profundi TaxID=2729140 RepID=A0ABR8LGA2_9ALTE|nr:GNAT family N-acetyltransferase [Salinimonas profundi]MBD3585288.1 N-acetyltransferase [Salinimonas profundi]